MMLFDTNLMIKQKTMLIGLFALVIISSFFYGLSVGIYKIPPYLLLNNAYDVFDTKNLHNNESLHIDVDVDSLIRINNEDDIKQMRINVIKYIWKQESFPYDKFPSSVQEIDDERYSGMYNLGKIEKITTNMEYGVDSNAYLFLATKNNNKLVIYHQGHDGDFILGKNTIQFFLNNDYSILAFSMPLVGMNSQPIVDLPNMGKLKLTTHDNLKFLESDQFAPIKYFVEPIAYSLNYIDMNYDFDTYYMIGISGGGWTTSFYSSLDPRIEKNYPVAGTSPLYLQFGDPHNMGDYEQTLPHLYNMQNYLDQYIMASYGNGREQLQIFNKNDPCCFSGTGYITYEDEIKERLSKLGSGNFSVFLDENNKYHSISNKSLEVILQNMQN